MRKMKMEYTQKSITIADGQEDYIKDCKVRNLSAGTIKHWKDTFTNMSHYISLDSLISELNENTMSEFILAHKEKGLSDMSLYSYCRDLRTLMYFFMEQGWLREFKIEVPKCSRTPVETYTDDELRILLKKPDIKTCSFTEYKAWCIVSFLLATGVRQNSLANIQIKDIDLDTNTVKINVTKNRKPLIIPLNNSIEKILVEYLRYRDGKPDDYLFCNVYGAKLTKSTLYHTIYVYNKSRGVETTGLHRFRHTYAKKSVLAGMNPVTLQKVLGHSSLNITQNYLNLLVTDIQQEVIDCDILQEFHTNRIKMKK